MCTKTDGVHYAIIEKVQYDNIKEPIKVYNLYVDDFHTYFVSAIGVFVHNTCKQELKQIKDKAKEYGLNKRAFGDYVEEYKQSLGMRNDKHFTWKELKELADEFTR